jgi:hypothetical protein
VSAPEIVEFVLAGSVAGQTVSATEGVPLTRFLDFNEDVRSYVQGSDAKTVLHDVKVQVSEGSYLLRVLIPPGLLPSLTADNMRLSQSASLAEIDPTRARVILRWQEKAKSEPGLSYAVRSPAGTFGPIVITKDSSLRREERVQWVAIERYLVGEITDWGGAQTPNVHLRLRNSRDSIIVDASEDQIRAQRENLVFHKAIVHVRARQNPKTGEVDRNSYKLIELRAFQPDVEEARLQQLFERGAKAWAGVAHGGEWVDELRGGGHG